ncbi:MAG TPA: preprotein translocase subunit SecG [Planctomycetaceae bacterium]|nr:preprotein translocase subunit SecG [Planctomycetaceae bacterium]
MWVPYVTMALLTICGVMLILIILLQRGRGGGLAGALGGMGGQSAFGTKAGDVFTKITVVLAIIWVVLAAGNVYALRGFGGPKFAGGSAATLTAPALNATGGEDPNVPTSAATIDDEASATPAPVKDNVSPDTAAPDKSSDEKAAPETPAKPAEAATPEAQPDASKSDPSDEPKKPE